jgi:DNA-binding HxlR family transcriptional regulator
LLYVRNKQVTDGHCAHIREVLARVGDKWSLLVVVTLSAGEKRFNELRRGIEGISQRMLTLTLRGLERDGLVSRRVTPTIPPRVDYALTPLGRTLIDPVLGLFTWADKNREAIQQARDRFDAEAVRRTRQSTGRRAS